MVERRLLMLEAYYPKDGNKQLWRLTNPPGLPFHDNVTDYSIAKPVYCKPGVVDAVTNVIALMSTSDEW